MSTSAQQHSEPAAPWGERFRRRYLEIAPRLLAALATLLGILTLIDAVVRSERERINDLTALIPVPATAAASAITAVAGLLLLRIAVGLRKRKRRAWRMAVGVTAVLVVAHVVKAHHIEEGGTALVFLILLITARSRFTAKADPTSRWFAVRVFFQFIAVAIISGLVMLYANPRHVVGSPSFGQRLQEVIWGLFGANGPVQLRGDRFSDVFYGTLLAFGLTTLVVVALLVLRPSEPVARLSEADEQRLRELLSRHGERDSLGYFALRRDKSVVWSASGKAAIAYRVVQGVALASGDPIGDPEAWPGAIGCFRDLVDEYGWTPAVMGCSELGATVFKREYDLSAYALGDEAIVDVCDFTLDGRAMRGVRQACTRVARAGYDVQVRRTKDIPRDELLELVRVADAWRGAEIERGFSMALSRIGDPADCESVMATACLDGTLYGMLNFVPWGTDGLSLDLMRRDRAADNGLNEFMIAELIKAAPGLEVRRVSLNFAVLRDAIERGERIGAGPIQRSWYWLIMFLSRFWQIESLYRFNVKFRPYWEPRFLSFPAARDLPRIAMAALEAEAFIVWPKGLKRLIGRG